MEDFRTDGVPDLNRTCTSAEHKQYADFLGILMLRKSLLHSTEHSSAVS
jgi:hypothetical protein